MINRKKNSKASIYYFLKSSGVLETGTHEQIQKVRAEYWRIYKRNWRINKRKTEKEFTISLTEEELKEINSESKRHRLSRTKFIKQACFAYINKSFIVPDSKAVKLIAQQLSITYNSIQELMEEDLIEIKSGKLMLDAIYNLERVILPVLNNPKTLEAFVKEHIFKNLKNKKRLIDYINAL